MCLCDFRFCLILFILVLFFSLVGKSAFFLLLPFYLILIRFFVSTTQHITLHIIGSCFLLLLSLLFSCHPSLHFSFPLFPFATHLFSMSIFIISVDCYFATDFSVRDVFIAHFYGHTKYFNLSYFSMLCMVIHYVRVCGI